MSRGERADDVDDTDLSESRLPALPAAAAWFRPALAGATDGRPGGGGGGGGGGGDVPASGAAGGGRLAGTSGRPGLPWRLPRYPPDATPSATVPALPSGPARGVWTGEVGAGDTTRPEAWLWWRGGVIVPGAGAGAGGGDVVVVEAGGAGAPDAKGKPMGLSDTAPGGTGDDDVDVEAGGGGGAVCVATVETCESKEVAGERAS